MPRQTLHLYVPRERRLFPNKSGQLSPATYFDVLPQLLHDLLNHRIQHTEYRSPCELLSRTSRSLGVAHYGIPTNHLYCMKALACKDSNNHTTLSDTSSLNGFATGDSTTCFLFSDLRYLFRGA